MNLQQQVTSLEISKKLKELGVKQESLFWWINEHLVYKTDMGAYLQNGGGIAERTFGCADKLSAFSVAELGEMLPIHLIKQSNANEKVVFEYHLFFSKQPNGYAIWYGQNYFDDKGYQIEKIEVDARGKMLIYLLENNLLPKE